MTPPQTLRAPGMNTLYAFLFSSTTLSIVFTQPPNVSRNCKDVLFTLSATAQNQLAKPPPPDVFRDPKILQEWASQPVVPNTVSGMQRIYGQYCEPTNIVPKRSDTIQLLVHGLTSSHDYFNGYQDEPTKDDPNSYAAFALEQGYSTLAIDRLGVLKSDHPDPLQVVQLAYQGELYHNLIQQLRGGNRMTANIRDNWTNVIWVGHSYGSILGTYISAHHPNDIDAFVQTGIALPDADQLVNLAPLIATYQTASDWDPSRFPPSEYPPGYLTFNSQSLRTDYFYSVPAVDFDIRKPGQEIAREGTTTWGENLGQGFANSTEYDRPVLVMTGVSDAVFCSKKRGGSSEADCEAEGVNRVGAMKTFYPAVLEERFETFLQPEAGHVMQMHFSAGQGFARIQGFLERHGM